LATARARAFSHAVLLTLFNGLPRQVNTAVGCLPRRRSMIDERMRQANPERWSGRTRNWLPVGSVVLNPKRAPSVRQLS